MRSPSAAEALGGAVPPGEHPEGSEGVPAARRSDAALEVEVDATRVDTVEQPPAVGLPLRSHDLHGLRHPGILVGAPDDSYTLMSRRRNMNIATTTKTVLNPMSTPACPQSSPLTRGWLSP
jgi:hypothetical protein